MAAVASRTSDLCVGSGGVLLNHRSPYRFAETFLQLHAMFPGHIDLRIGRATSGQVIDFALQQARSTVLREENYEDHVAVHKRSRRAVRAFISVNCSALRPALVSSALFGHEEGAFTEPRSVGLAASRWLKVERYSWTKWANSCPIPKPRY